MGYLDYDGTERQIGNPKFNSVSVTGDVNIGSPASSSIDAVLSFTGSLEGQVPEAAIYTFTFENGILVSYASSSL